MIDRIQTILPHHWRGWCLGRHWLCRVAPEVACGEGPHSSCSPHFPLPKSHTAGNCYCFIHGSTLSLPASVYRAQTRIISHTCQNGQDQKHWWHLMLERMWGKGNTPPLLAGVLQLLWKSAWWFLRKLGNELPQNPAIPIFGIYPKNAQSYHKDECSTMFTAALFVITRTCKQPRCPLTKQ